MTEYPRFTNANEFLPNHIPAVLSLSEQSLVLHQAF